MGKNNLIKITIGTVLILLVPLLSMVFTDEVAWSYGDFIVFGSLLLGTGLAYELITNRVKEKYRGVFAVLLIALLFIVWAEMAVGIFGSPIAGN